MSVVRNSDWVYIQGEAVRDERLSFRARGLHHLLVSQSSKAVLDVDELASCTTKEGRGEVQAALRELEDLGYIEYSATGGKCTLNDFPLTAEGDRGE